VPALLQGAGRNIANKIKEAYRAIGKAPEGPTLYPAGLPEQGLWKLILETPYEDLG
jgi:hypothetical protein